ncbi:hypothetical protein C5E10_12940 [Pseudoclavibacter sp. RFBG4]|nr:hypothetical protein C5E10_12940 [Pseudoclavibacter sp. RFBG4]
MWPGAVPRKGNDIKPQLCRVGPSDQEQGVVTVATTLLGAQAEGEELLRRDEVTQGRTLSTSAQFRPIR